MEWSRRLLKVGGKTRRISEPHLGCETKERSQKMPQRRSWLYIVLALAGGSIGGAVAAQFVSGVAMAATHTRKVEAEQFVMVDRGGTQRATLQVTARGISTLAMYDAEGATARNCASPTTAALQSAFSVRTGRIGYCSARLPLAAPASQFTGPTADSSLT